MFSWYTSLSRTTRLRLGVVGMVVAGAGLYLDSRVDEHRSEQTVREVTSPLLSPPVSVVKGPADGDKE